MAAFYCHFIAILRFKCQVTTAGCYLAFIRYLHLSMARKNIQLTLPR